MEHSFEHSKWPLIDFRTFTEVTPGYYRPHPKDGEGNVFSLCVSSHLDGGYPIHWWGILPSQVQGAGGTPFPGPGGDTPSQVGWVTPFPGPARGGRGTPPSRSDPRMGGGAGWVPLPHPGQFLGWGWGDVPPSMSHTGMGGWAGGEAGYSPSRSDPRMGGWGGVPPHPGQIPGWGVPPTGTA